MSLWRFAVVSSINTVAADPLCLVNCETEPPWIELVVQQIPQMRILNKIGGFGDQLSIFLCFSNHFRTVFPEFLHIGALHYLSKGSHRHKRVDMVCRNPKVDGTCQSYIHTDGGTRGYCLPMLHDTVLVPVEQGPAWTPCLICSYIHNKLWCTGFSPTLVY